MSASPPRDQASPHQQDAAAHSPPSYDPEASVSPSNEDTQDPEPSPQDPDSPQEPSHPPFEPIFTLLANTTTNTITHPRVHYIFTDDDPAPLTDPDPTRRSLLVDLVPSQPSASASPAPAWSVSWAASLSPDFAVTSSRLTEQQQGEGMLRLEGVEREPVELERVKGGQEDSEEEEEREEATPGVEMEQEGQEALVEDFKRRMGVLNKVIDEAQKRELVVLVAEDLEKAGEDEEDEDDGEEAVASGGRGGDGGHA
ncbi:hypothetical protein NLU13_8252 [Sarocladium strictum]|uniref:Uncharacterized protein n=1 Tax=Sarocladium strictum TaxID=5046 RepID=A0AA39GCG3_SARSR|nr:hypothetical protein NLU13_8252 [Sarocladium strictum]